MIAEPAYRRRGLAYESIQLMMNYSAEVLGVERFVVKIGAHNESSVNLFEKKLGFRIVEYVECFDEIVLFKDTSIEGTVDESENADDEAKETTQTNNKSVDTNASNGDEKAATSPTSTNDQDESNLISRASQLKM